jgi:hypothetical protein
MRNPIFHLTEEQEGVRADAMPGVFAPVESAADRALTMGKVLRK